MKNEWADAYMNLYDNLKAIQEDEKEFRRKFPSEYNNGRVDALSEVMGEVMQWMPKGVNNETD